MNKCLRGFIVLTVILLNVFVFMFGLLPSAVEATWVEGHITQDTVWTLVDSPFVIIGNVTVDPSVTLTIEPGVEVLFGGHFKITVEGKLVAKGTQSHTIKFSSNREEPTSGDWAGIIFGGSEPSTLEQCIIEYAVNGTTIENSIVKIRNSEIKNCSQNAIAIFNSDVTVQSNKIVGNLQNGICVSGEGQVNIKDNEFKGNGNGILLTGESASNIDIRNNNVFLNKQNGIQLDANNHDNVTILYNILSSNDYGFYISGEASTSIMNNSITYNAVGFYYENIMQNHTVHFNDIYGNEIGMDVTVDSEAGNVYVNAEYNYWGDRSGPYHKALNPEGRGNEVGGNGVDLDFIPFLTANISHINERPIAVLLVDKDLVAPNQTVTFIATLSSDEGRVDEYFYDFGDGENSNWTTLSVIVHNYSFVGEFTARLMVMDDFGVKSTNASKTIHVQNLTPLEVSLTPDSYAVDYGENISITVKVTDEGEPVENANVKLLTVGGGSFLSDSGPTDSSGYFTTVFTAPEVTYLTNVMIVATASKNGYADGSDHKYVDVIPPLVINVNAEPSQVKSEGTAEVNVYVTYDGEPVADVLVSVTASNGSFVTQDETTDLNGECTFIYNAPMTVIPLEIAMKFIATKDGYLPGQGQLILAVQPKTLVVEVSVNPNVVQSEEEVNIRVHVTYEENSIANATVEISSFTGGNFSKSTELTDSDGYLTSVFTSPPVNEETIITIRVTAKKTGYALGEGSATITVNPGILKVKVEVNPTLIGSEDTATVTVQVHRNGTPVSDVSVTVSSDRGGAFSPSSGVTDAEGIVSFTFIAPRTDRDMNVTITVEASKNGYLGSEAHVSLIVSPEVALGPVFGLPWWFIAIIIVVVVIIGFIVLVKLKVIVISWKEE